jgi:WD40 repeat protein
VDLPEIERRLSRVESALRRLGAPLEPPLTGPQRDPPAVCVQAGVVVEHILRDLWKRLGLKGSPARRQFEDLLTNTVRKLEDDGTPVPGDVHDGLRTLQLKRNRAAHDYQVTRDDALYCLLKLADFAQWYFGSFLPSREPSVEDGESAAPGGTKDGGSESPPRPDAPVAGGALPPPPGPSGGSPTPTPPPPTVPPASPAPQAAPPPAPVVAPPPAKGAKGPAPGAPAGRRKWIGLAVILAGLAAVGWLYWHDSRLLFTFKGHNGAVNGVTFDPTDGKRLASGSGGFDERSKPLQGWVKVWEDTGQEVLTLGGDFDDVEGVAISPDGRYLAAAGYRTVKVWDLTKKQEFQTFKGYTNYVFSVAFSPDSRWLATGSYSDPVQVWDVATAAKVLSLPTNEPMTAADGTLLYTDAHDVAFSPDGRRLAAGCGDSVVRVWQLDAGGAAPLTRASWTLGVPGSGIDRPPVGEHQGHRNAVYCVAFSPDSKYLASGSVDRTIRVWDLATMKEFRVLSHQQTVNSVAFRPDGQYLAAGCGNVGDEPDKPGELKVWDWNADREVFSRAAHKGRVHCVAFSPDGKRLASAGQDHTVKIWDATNLDVPFR